MIFDDPCVAIQKPSMILNASYIPFVDWIVVIIFFYYCLNKFQILKDILLTI